MPEMKRNFTKGKMNKDLDERLVPPGEYRDAMNIQVSTSEGSDVGTIQNVLGNTPGCEYNDPAFPNPILSSSTTVGSVSDEKHDTLYWLVAGPNNIEDILPLNLGIQATLKDMIMRTGPLSETNNTGCEPVFVDKHGWCIGISDNSLGNSITFSDPLLYDNITSGMELYGYNGINQTFGPAVVSSVGYLNTLYPINYYQEFTTTITPPTTSPIIGFRLRTFEHPSGNGLFSKNYDSGVSTYTNPAASTPGVDQAGNAQPDIIQVISFVATLPAEFQVGATFDAMFIMGGLITNITNDWVCGIGSDIGTNSGSCLQAYIITIDKSNASYFDMSMLTVSANPQGPPGWQGEVFAYASTFGTATFDPADLDITTNTIQILPSSDYWLDEIYSLLWDDSGVQTGYDLRITGPAAIHFPPNTCIDPNSVDDVGDGFSPPTSYDNRLEIIGCQLKADGTVNSLAGVSLYGLTPGMGDKPITLTVDANGIQSIFLNETVSLSGSDALCFTSERVLEFEHENLITGINIIDDMLFWTDNFTEPKKINIPRSVVGTESLGETHTAVVNEATGLDLVNNYNPIRKEHITVIRKSPKNTLNLEMSSGRNPDLTYSGITYTAIDPALNANVNASSIISSSNNSVITDFSTLQLDDSVQFEIETDLNGNEDFTLQWQPGNIILLKEYNDDGTSPPIPLANWTIRGVITSWQWNSFVNDTSTANYQSGYVGSQWNGGQVPSSAQGTAHVEIQIVGLDGTPPQPDPLVSTVLNYAVDLENKSEPIFEDKFPRFSYRYKYGDGEYSTFAPWSEVAFLPSNFNYESSRGYNKGMLNHATSIKLQGFVPTVLGQPIGQDVIEVDILYKEEGSPNVYVVETISPLDLMPTGIINPWYTNTYKITSESIKYTLPSNQTLRPWDNVPKKALAQEITGSRVVYGNYEQNYDLLVGSDKFKPEFKSFLSSWGDGTEGSVERSIKSLRDYKLGVVFTDDYGRETPILISESGGFKVDKRDSDKANRLITGLQGSAPQSMAYFKFFVKETSTEYYNLAMDRWYQAEDGNIWLAFPSNDRNKVDLETSLYFKKGNEDVVENITRYKVLAIENEAPEFIKTRKLRIGTVTHNPSASPQPLYLFGNPAAWDDDVPRINGISFAMNWETATTLYGSPVFGSSSLSNLDTILEDLYVQFVLGSNHSAKYKVSEITKDELAATEQYFVTLGTNLKQDMDFIFDNPASPGAINDEVKVIISKAVIENKPKFDGRFFVKIENDGKIKTQITDDSIGVNYVETNRQTVYALDGDTSLTSRQINATWSGSGSSVVTPNYIGANWYQGYMTRLVDFNFAGISGPFALDSNYTGPNDNNPGGSNINYFYARQSYFFYAQYEHFGHDENYGCNGGALTYPNKIGDGESGVEGGCTGGVWFIDRSTHKHESNSGGDGSVTDIFWNKGANMLNFIPSDDNLAASAGWTPSDVGSGTTHFSIAGTRMYLGFGGIENDLPFQQHVFDDGSRSWHTGPYGGPAPESDFFSIGESGVGRHGDANTAGFVENLTSGTKFKWENDPTETIYTFYNQVSVRNKVRFSRDDSALPVGSFPSGLGAGGQPLLLDESSGSYHRNWELWMEPSMSNSVGANGSGWDPTDAPGTIMTNGLQLQDIQLQSHSVWGSSSFTTQKENYLIVDTIKSTCQINSAQAKYELHVGMMLTQYNNLGAVPDQPNLVVKKITYDPATTFYRLDLGGYTEPLHWNGDDISTDLVDGQNLEFRQVSMNGASNFTEHNTDYYKDFWTDINNVYPAGAMAAVGYDMIMVEAVDEYSDGGNLPPDPFVWETEPKDDTGLDIYYEISENNPITLNTSTITSAIPIGSRVQNTSGFGHPDWNDVLVVNNVSAVGDTIVLSVPWNPPGIYIGSTPFVYGSLILQGITVGDTLKITKPNGVAFNVTIAAIIPDIANPLISTEFVLETSIYNSEYHLNWYNCFSFRNGVESNRIKDNFNLPYIINGVKASTTLDIEYKQERREYGFIYSGLYNSMSGVNNLNQFIQAEKITKDINPNYGSIQKLKAGWGQSGDLIALCEDRILKILANKDALFNADGNTNVTATNRVLGTAMPYSGEYGISTNPESFASESYRAYFTDKVRGTVMRLSMDGLTPISEFGMKDWFRDNLKLNNNIIGSYDDKKDEYNISLENTTENIGKSVTFKENVKGWVSFKSFITNNGISCANEYYTFKDANLWKHNHDIPGNRNTFYGTFNTNSHSTFKVILNDAPGIVKSFYTLNYEGTQSKVDQLVIDPVTGLSDGEYYNLNAKKGWYVDNIETNKEKGSLNEFIEKEGKWFNYIRGENIFLNPDSSIHLENDGYSTWDQDSFAIQGLGALNGVPSPATVLGCVDPAATNYGCAVGNMPPCFDSPNLDGGNCFYTDPIEGCITVNGTAVNNDCVSGNTSYPCNDGVTSDDGSCLWIGCTNPLSTNYASNYGGTFPAEAVSYNVNYPGAIFDDGSCIMPVYGCTDNTMFNYNPSATNDDGSCIAFIYGCLGQNNILATQASNYNIPPGVNTDDGTCAWSFCSNPADANYNALAAAESVGYFPQNNVNTNDCISGGCTDATATNYSVDANGDAINTLGNVITYDDGSCLPVTYTCGGYPMYLCVDLGLGNGPFATLGDCNAACVADVLGCYFDGSQGWNDLINDGGPNANSTWQDVYGAAPFPYVAAFNNNVPFGANQDNGTCSWLAPATGCTDPTAGNYDPLAVIDDSSCIYCTGYTHTVDSITQPSAPGATDGSIVISITSQYPLGGLDLAYGMTPPVNITTSDITVVYSNGNQNATITINNIGEFGSFNLAFYDNINFNTNFCQIMNEDFNFPPVVTVIPGCTDPNDFYYNPFATIDNGTCSVCNVDPSNAIDWDASDAGALVYSQYPCNVVVEYPTNSGNYYQNVFCANISGTDYNLAPGTYGSIWLPCDQPTTPSCDLNNLAYVNNSSAWAPMQQMTYVTGDVVLYNNYYYVATFDLTSATDNPNNYQYIPGSYYAGVGGGGSPWVLCLSTTN